jgi:hypothetical protein
LWRDVLDREVAGVNALLAEVLQPVEQVFAVSHVVDVARFERLAELAVGKVSAFLPLPMESDLETLEGGLFLDAVGEAGENLVEAVGLEVARAAPEHVALPDIDSLDEFFK